METYEKVIEALTDIFDLNAEQEHLQSEMKIVVEMIRKLIGENTQVAMEQAEYERKYNGYCAWYEDGNKRLAEISELRMERTAKRAKIRICMDRKKEVGKIRVAIYCRVGRDNDCGKCIDIQKENLLEYARQQRAKVVAEVVEVGSGHSVNRPGIREISGLVHRHTIEKVIVTDISHISRETGAVLRFISKLEKQHVVLDTLYGDSFLDYRGLVRRFGGKHL